MTITTQLEPHQVLERIRAAWGHDLDSGPGPVAEGSAVSSQEFQGHYVTPGRAPARVTLHASIEATPKGRRVRIALEAGPDPGGFRSLIGVSLLLPALALLVDAVEPLQALLWFVAVVGLISGLAWIIARVVIGRISSGLEKSLPSEP